MGLYMRPVCLLTMQMHTTMRTSCRARTESPMLTGSASTAKSDGIPRPESGWLKSSASNCCSTSEANAMISAMNRRSPYFEPTFASASRNLCKLLAKDWNDWASTTEANAIRTIFCSAGSMSLSINNEDSSFSSSSSSFC